MNRRMIAFVGTLAPLALWIGVKSVFGITDRYLPGPVSVIAAISDLGWPLVGAHVGATLVRTLIGLVLAVAGGVLLALGAFRARLFPLLMPTVNALRAVPPVAMVPFFLLWFGFSEAGRYLLVALGLGLNIFVACADVLERPEEAEVVNFRNFQLPTHSLLIDYWTPRLAESLLPTLRFGIALALGLITVSEMLGAQYGLGYLMQTSRATFSLNVLILCTLILGVMATAADAALQWTWLRLVTWRR
jgi:ABC-type nitrate/sulfonate/bicarbonate transport system permease component